MYIDLIIKIKNAQRAGQNSLKTFYSKMDLAIAEILAENKYLAGVEKKGRLPKRILEIKINEHKTINGIKLISRPSRRIYASYQNLKPVRQGYGLGIISTSKGIMTTKEAKKQKVGGQLLFEIW